MQMGLEDREIKKKRKALKTKEEMEKVLFGF
jgi:hypothetical protein